MFLAPEVRLHLSSAPWSNKSCAHVPVGSTSNPGRCPQGVYSVPGWGGTRAWIWHIFGSNSSRSHRKSFPNGYPGQVFSHVSSTFSDQSGKGRRWLNLNSWGHGSHGWLRPPSRCRGNPLLCGINGNMSFYLGSLVGSGWSFLPALLGLLGVTEQWGHTVPCGVFSRSPGLYPAGVVTARVCLDVANHSWLKTPGSQLFKGRNSTEDPGGFAGWVLYYVKYFESNEPVDEGRLSFSFYLQHC